MSRRSYTKSESLLAQEETRQPTASRLERIKHAAYHRQRGMMLMMEDVYNPHNLAAVTRTCDAFGVHDIAYTIEQHDEFDPKQTSIVTSGSASKWVDYRLFETGTVDALNMLHAEGWFVAAVADDDAVPLYDMDCTQYDQLVLLVGNERRGLSDTAVRMADRKVVIPMLGMIHSLNVSVAAAIMLSEITRQRQASPKRFTISDDEAEALIVNFIHRR
jgi:tRNA (guanosine-2'-O-)-methyltransferase